MIHAPLVRMSRDEMGQERGGSRRFGLFPTSFMTRGNIGKFTAKIEGEVEKGNYNIR